MKEQYVGDVNDYRKYLLLRALAISGDLRLTVCWMLTPADGRSDGQKTEYLRQPQRWRAFDPILFDLLKEVGSTNSGSRLRLIEESGVIPRATFHNTILKDNTKSRCHYIQDALRCAQGSDLVFFDPDNGIEISSKRKGNRDSAKYIYFDELAETYDRNHSILIYQHFPRQRRAEFIELQCQRLVGYISPHQIWTIQTPHVAFFILGQPSHTLAIKRALEQLVPYRENKWLGLRQYS